MDNQSLCSCRVFKLSILFAPALFNVMEDVFQGHFGEHDSASAISRLLLLMMSGMLSLQRSTLHYDAPPVDGGSDLGRRRRGHGGHCDSLRSRSRCTLGHALLTARVESATVTVSNAILVAAAGGRVLRIYLVTFGST